MTISYQERVAMSMRELRLKAGLSQLVVAHALELSQSAYSRIESGQSSIPVQYLALFAVCVHSCPSDILRHAERPLTASEHNAIMLESACRDIR